MISTGTAWSPWTVGRVWNHNIMTHRVLELSRLRRRRRGVLYWRNLLVIVRRVAAPIPQIHRAGRMYPIHAMKAICILPTHIRWMLKSDALPTLGFGRRSSRGGHAACISHMFHVHHLGGCQFIFPLLSFLLSAFLGASYYLLYLGSLLLLLQGFPGVGRGVHRYSQRPWSSTCMGLCTGSSGSCTTRVAGITCRRFPLGLGSLGSNMCGLTSSGNDVSKVVIVLFYISCRWLLLRFFAHGDDGGEPWDFIWALWVAA